MCGGNPHFSSPLACAAEHFKQQTRKAADLWGTKLLCREDTFVLKTELPPVCFVTRAPFKSFNRFNVLLLAIITHSDKVYTLISPFPNRKNDLITRIPYNSKTTMDARRPQCMMGLNILRCKSWPVSCDFDSIQDGWWGDYYGRRFQAKINLNWESSLSRIWQAPAIPLKIMISFSLNRRQECAQKVISSCTLLAACPQQIKSQSPPLLTYSQT